MSPWLEGAMSSGQVTAQDHSLSGCLAYVRLKSWCFCMDSDPAMRPIDRMSQRKMLIPYSTLLHICSWTCSQVCAGEIGHSYESSIASARSRQRSFGVGERQCLACILCQGCRCHSHRKNSQPAKDPPICKVSPWVPGRILEYCWLHVWHSLDLQADQSLLANAILCCRCPRFAYLRQKPQMHVRQHQAQA